MHELKKIHGEVPQFSLLSDGFFCLFWRGFVFFVFFKMATLCKEQLLPRIFLQENETH